MLSPLNDRLKMVNIVVIICREIKLNKKGIITIGDLAHYPHRYLKKDFGILGTDMHLHANGIDQSKIREKSKINNPAICKSQILMRDYQFKEAK